MHACCPLHWCGLGTVKQLTGAVKQSSMGSGMLFQLHAWCSVPEAPTLVRPNGVSVYSAHALA